MATILIVDDEPPVREVLARWLQAAGHQTREAGNSNAALEAMAAAAADLVFCDVQMPGPDGLWLTGELRRRFPLSAVVLATGVSTVPGKISMQYGVMAYLLKPFDKTAVLDAVRQAMEWKVAATARGAESEDNGDQIAAWLASIDDALAP